MVGLSLIVKVLSLILFFLRFFFTNFPELSFPSIEQNVTFIGKEEIKIGEKIYKTLHFNFKSSDETLPDSKKLNTDIWYEENTYLWVKAAFEKTGYWEYRIKNVK